MATKMTSPIFPYDTASRGYRYDQLVVFVKEKDIIPLI
jgi:hypothetical protein